MAVHVAADAAFHIGYYSGDGAAPALDEWTNDGPPVVLMTVRNRARLEAIARKYGDAVHAYSDPDLNDGICAIAIYALHWNDDRARMARFADAGPER